MSMNHFQLGRGQCEGIQLIDRQCNNEALRPNARRWISSVIIMFHSIGCRMIEDSIMLTFCCEVGF